MRMTKPVSFLSARGRWLAVSALVALTGVSLPGATSERRLGLSTDLQQIIGRRSERRERIIVRGTGRRSTPVLAQHGVSLVRRLAMARSSRPTASQLDGLVADQAVDHLSGDALVRPSMAVSNRAMGADQTWARQPRSRAWPRRPFPA